MSRIEQSVRSGIGRKVWDCVPNMERKQTCRRVKRSSENLIFKFSDDLSFVLTNRSALRIKPHHIFPLGQRQFLHGMAVHGFERDGQTAFGFKNLIHKGFSRLGVAEF